MLHSKLATIGSGWSLCGDFSLDWIVIFMEKKEAILESNKHSKFLEQWKGIL